MKTEKPRSSMLGASRVPKLLQTPPATVRSRGGVATSHDNRIALQTYPTISPYFMTAGGRHLLRSFWFTSFSFNFAQSASICPQVSLV